MSEAPPKTTPALSRVHAAMLEAELKKATSRTEVKAIAERHAPYLLTKDRDRLRSDIAARARALAA